MGSASRLDHLATWDEVCDAISLMAHDGFEFVSDEHDFGDRDLDFGLGALSEEAAWLALASEEQEATRN